MRSFYAYHDSFGFWGDLERPRNAKILFPPNMRSFRSPGNVVRGLDLGNGPKSVNANWPLWSPVVSSGLQGSPVDDETDNRYSSEVSNTTYVEGKTIYK